MDRMPDHVRDAFYSLERRRVGPLECIYQFPLGVIFPKSVLVSPSGNVVLGQALLLKHVAMAQERDGSFQDAMVESLPSSSEIINDYPAL
jgi:hypothetical protein